MLMLYDEAMRSLGEDHLGTRPTFAESRIVLILSCGFYVVAVAAIEAMVTIMIKEIMIQIVAIALMT